MPVLQKMSICFFKRFLPAMHSGISGKIYIRHLFRYGQLISYKTYPVYSSELGVTKHLWLEACAAHWFKPVPRKEVRT